MTFRKFFKEIGPTYFPNYQKCFFSVFLVYLKIEWSPEFGQYNTLPFSQFRRFCLEGQIPKMVEIIWNIYFSFRAFCGWLQNDCGFKSSSATKIKLLSKRQLFVFLFQLFDSTQLRWKHHCFGLRITATINFTDVIFPSQKLFFWLKDASSLVDN